MLGRCEPPSPSAGPVLSWSWSPSDQQHTRKSPSSDVQTEPRAARVKSVIRHERVKPVISKSGRRGSFSSIFGHESVEASVKQLVDSTTAFDSHGNVKIEIFTGDVKADQEPVRKLYNISGPPAVFRRAKSSAKSRRLSHTSPTRSEVAKPCAPHHDVHPSNPMITHTASAHMSSHPMITRTASAQMAVDFQVLAITRRPSSSSK